MDWGSVADWLSAIIALLTLIGFIIVQWEELTAWRRKPHDKPLSSRVSIANKSYLQQTPKRFLSIKKDCLTGLIVAVAVGAIFAAFDVSEPDIMNAVVILFVSLVMSILGAVIGVIMGLLKVAMKNVPTGLIIGIATGIVVFRFYHVIFGGDFDYLVLIGASIGGITGGIIAYQKLSHT